MSFSYIGEKYIKLLGSSLELFSDNGNDTYTCRCKFCGDSQKCSYKTRGYFYLTEHNNWRYKCHNCSINKSITEVLMELDVNLYNDYRMEIFKEKGTSRKYNSTTKSSKIDKIDNPSSELSTKVLSSILPISTLPKNNIATQYLSDRMIPKERFKHLYYTDNLINVVKYIPTYDIDKVPNMKGIIIPYFDENHILQSFQVRNLDTNSKMRYLSYDVCNNPTYIYNLENIKVDETLYVFEGAFDSMFCNNAVSASGASILHKLETIKKKNADVVIAFDCDYKKNDEIMNLLETIIDLNYKVVIYDDSFDCKDINQYIKKHELNQKDIEKYLEKHTYQGLSAKFELSKVKKQKNKTPIKIAKGCKKSIFYI